LQQNQQFTREQAIDQSATERGVDEEYRWFLSKKYSCATRQKPGQLAKSDGQLCRASWRNTTKLLELDFVVCV